MNRRYRIGDRVLVRPDLTGSTKYYSDDGNAYDGVSESMTAYAGQYVTIDDYYNRYGYFIKEDKQTFSWIDGMFVDERCDADVDVTEFL